MPIALLNQIKAMEGVETVSPLSWYGGTYNEEPMAFAQFGVDAETIFTIYGEFTVPPEQLEAFQTDRAGCVIGRKLAEERGIKLGDPGPTAGASWVPNEQLGTSFETVEVPLELSIAGKRSMTGRVTATKAVAPLSLCGGVLTAHAVNADDPTTRLEIRLLGASRGTGGQAFQAHERMLRRLKADER